MATAQAIQERHSAVHVVTDLIECPGDALPPLIGGYRPDIIARSNAANLDFIAEAKTDRDIDNNHTQRQINAFVNHLDVRASRQGIFILTVNGQVADTARTVLRFACRHYVSSSLRVQLFDGLDFWTLGPFGAPVWHLS